MLILLLSTQGSAIHQLERKRGFLEASFSFLILIKYVAFKKKNESLR
jgi:hypothetical protein